MLHTILRKFTITALTAIAAIGVAAQTYRLPSAHTAEHKNLIARQENIGNQISVKDTQDFLDNLFKDEAEPELDIYTEGWNSKSVNAYAGMEVPDMQTIDVSNFAMPCPGYVTSPYGYRPRFRREHKGIDLKLQTGDTVYAAFPGRVRLTNFERRGYGHYVILRHPNGLETVYGHLSKILVKPDQDVKVGEPIALGGNTGRSFGSPPPSRPAIWERRSTLRLYSTLRTRQSTPTPTRSTKTLTRNRVTSTRLQTRNMHGNTGQHTHKKPLPHHRQAAKVPNPTQSAGATPSAA